MHDITLYGLILCGGQSSRMGEDKSMLDYHGLPQREYLFALLQRFCVRVYTSCRAEQSIPANLNPLPDVLAIKGPMNGIVSAFRAHSHTAWLVVAVDMPFIDDAAIQRTVSATQSLGAGHMFYEILKMDCPNRCVPFGKHPRTHYWKRL